MKLKQLESLLQDVEPFRTPNQELEQYPTGAHLAARCIAAAHENGDIEDRFVVDLGVGGGVLTIGSLLMGAREVVGVDLDPNALALTRDNCDCFDPPLKPELVSATVPDDILRLRRAVTDDDIKKMDDEDMRRAEESSSSDEEDDVEQEKDEGDEKEEAKDQKSHPHPPLTRPLRVDTVVMNPPFGTRVRGADMGFLRAGLTIARNAVYSLHKTSTRSHIEKHALLTLRAKSATVLAELRYELPKVYKHHRMDSVEIEVDLWMFEPPEDGIVGGGQMDHGDEDDSDGDDDDESRNGDSHLSEQEKARRKEVELKYAGARNAFADRRDFEPRRQGWSGGKGARGAVLAGRGGRGRGRGRG